MLEKCECIKNKFENQDKPQLIIFVDKSCSYCEELKDILKEVLDDLREFIDVSYFYINCAGIKEKFNIKSIPTSLWVEKGKVKEKAEGVYAILNQIQKNLKNLEGGV